MNLTNEFEPIRTWARERGLYDKGDVKTQLVKLSEEVGELSQAILKNNQDGIVDAVGDCVIVLTNLARIGNYDIEDCINYAYKEIKDRTGEIKDGTFVKD